MPDAKRRLAVLVGHELCGTLVEGVGLGYEFAYSPRWAADRRPAVSLSLPNDGSTISHERYAVISISRITGDNMA